MFQKINYGAKWCVHALLGGIAMVFVAVVVVAGAAYAGIASLNNWLMSE